MKFIINTSSVESDIKIKQKYYYFSFFTDLFERTLNSSKGFAICLFQIQSVINYDEYL